MAARFRSGSGIRSGVPWPIPARKCLAESDQLPGVIRSERPSSSAQLGKRAMKRTVRAFQLMHVLLHELGHHHDRISTRSKVRSSRGEGYAESYAVRYSNCLWEAYASEFGW